ncbi:MAG: MATE family efflux transporter, partial [Lentisphaerae bacterium]
MKNLFRRSWEGEGGARLLLQIAFPMIVSQGAETLMMFVDRLFLARLSPVHLAAAMGAGIAMFTMTTFFVGVLGYVNAMVAQYFGVNKMAEAGRAAGQGIIFACLSYPLALILTLGVIPLLQYVGHTPEQILLEKQYIQVLAWGTILFLLRTALGSFFSGIGRTRIVMIANLVALIVNIPANYLLIFGKFGCPRLEMAGAAYGTLLGSLSGVAILLCAFFSASNRQRFQTHRNIRFDRKLFARLWYYGSPAGTEFFLNILAFTVFVEFFHAYSRVAAAAVTIVFSWDLIAFLPVTGIGIGVTSLVGRYSGRKDWPSATRSAYIALGVT